MNPGMVQEKLFDFFTAVDRSPIPQQNDGASEMSEQSSKERPDIQTVKVPPPESEIKRQAFAFWRHRQGIDGGNSALFVEVIEDRSFSFRSPGATDIGNEQEARFINENQMGPKSFGLFLYGATGKPSNAQFLSRSFVKPGALVSGNSIPFSEAAAIRDSDDTGCQSVCGWFGQSVSRSKGLSDTLRPADLTRVALLGFPSRSGRAWEDALGSSSNEGPWTHPPGTLGTIEKRSSLMLLLFALRPRGLFCLLPAWQWRGDGAFPVPLAIPGVSCPIL